MVVWEKLPTQDWGFVCVWWSLAFFADPSFFLCMCTGTWNSFSLKHKTLDVNSSFELIHFLWKPRDWNYSCWGWQLGPPSGTRSSGFDFADSSFFPDQAHSSKLYINKGRILFVSISKFKTETVYEAWLLFMIFVGETDTVFPTTS